MEEVSKIFNATRRKIESNFDGLIRESDDAAKLKTKNSHTGVVYYILWFALDVLWMKLWFLKSQEKEKEKEKESVWVCHKSKHGLQQSMEVGGGRNNLIYDDLVVLHNITPLHWGILKNTSDTKMQPSIEFITILVWRSRSLC